METSNTQQETTMKTEPQKEHLWLQRFIGEWTFEGEAMMEPGPAASEVHRDRERAVAGGSLVSG
jgi:hypothetical protein